MNMQLDFYYSVKKKVLNDLINDLAGLEYPADWNSKDVLRLVINKLKDEESKC